MGCRENSHVHRQFARFADRTNGLLLNQAQELHLHVQRQIRDLIEKQGAALGRLHESLLVGRPRR